MSPAELASLKVSSKTLTDQGIRRTNKHRHTFKPTCAGPVNMCALKKTRLALNADRLEHREMDVSSDISPVQRVETFQHLERSLTYFEQGHLVGSFRRLFVSLSLLGVLTAACNDNSPCVTLPCPQPLTITVTVRAGASSSAVTGAFVQVAGMSSAIPCIQSPGSTCNIFGSPGTFQLDIGAPGFQTVHRSVIVVGSSAECGCPVVGTQHLDIALVTAA